MARQDVAQWPPTGRPDLRSFVPRERRVAPLLLWLACLAAAVGLLLWLGDGRLAAPDLTAPSTWGAWAADRGTAEAVVAVLRLVALGLAWYLVGVTTVSVLAHAARAARLVRLADALSVGPVRTVVQQALGVGLAVGVVASAVPPDALGAARPVAAASASAIVDDDPSIGRPDAAGSDDATALDRGGAVTQAGATAVPADEHARLAPGTGASPPVPAPRDDAPRLVARPLDDGSATTPPARTSPAEMPPAPSSPAVADDAPTSTAATPPDATPASPMPIPGPVRPTTRPTVPPAAASVDDPTARATDRLTADRRRVAGDARSGSTPGVDHPGDVVDDDAGAGAAAAPGAADPGTAADLGAADLRAGDPGVDRRAAGDGPREVRVEPGDHLWGLAEEHLCDELGREPTEGEILHHWRRVIDLNTDRLVVPSNPDLLRPGQRIVLPPVEVGG